VKRCEAKIRPFPNPTELQCRLGSTHSGDHEAELRDYAYPGSLTEISWAEEDRRTYRGDWVECPATPACILPANHPGRCAK